MSGDLTGVDTEHLRSHVMRWSDKLVHLDSYYLDDAAAHSDDCSTGAQPFCDQ